jgi:hypothetical protein
VQALQHLYLEFWQQPMYSPYFDEVVKTAQPIQLIKHMACVADRVLSAIT